MYRRILLVNPLNKLFCWNFDLVNADHCVVNISCVFYATGLKFVSCFASE